MLKFLPQQHEEAERVMLGYRVCIIQNKCKRSASSMVSVLLCQKGIISMWMLIDTVFLHLLFTFTDIAVVMNQESFLIWLILTCWEVF